MAKEKVINPTWRWPKIFAAPVRPSPTLEQFLFFCVGSMIDAALLPPAAQATLQPRHAHVAHCFPAGTDHSQMVVYGGSDNSYNPLKKAVVVLETAIWDWWAPPLKGKGPRGISGVASFTLPHQNLLVLFGGQDPSGGVTDELYSLHVRRWQWNPIRVSGSTPAARSYSSLVTIQGNAASGEEHTQALLFGGSLRDAVSSSTHLLVMSEGGWKWEEPAIRGTPPMPRHEHCAVVVKHDMVVFGGHNGHQFFHDVHVLSCDVWEWSEVRTFGLPAWPLGSSFYGRLLGDDQLVVVSSDGQEDINVHSLDLNTLGWRKPIVCGEMPTTRFGFSLADTHDGKLLLFGGCSDATAYNDTVVLDFHLPWKMEKWLWLAHHRSQRPGSKRRQSILHRLPKKILKRIVALVPHGLGG